MKKLKKLAIIALFAVSIIVSVCGFTACDLIFGSGGGGSADCEHSYGEWTDLINNCTEHTQKAVCTKCDNEKFQTVTPEGHKYGEWKNIVDNCTEHVQERACSVCNAKQTQELEPQGHDEGQVATVYSDCTVYIQQRTCKKCGIVLDSVAYIRDEHNYGEWTDIVNTCTEHVQERTCSECDAKQTQEFITSGHSFGAWTDIVNGCTQHVQKRACRVCGEEETKTLTTSGHKYGEWTDLVNTCTEHIQKQVCSECGDELTREAEIRGHFWGDWIDIVNTCTEYAQKTACAYCGLEQTRTAAPRGHSFSNGKCLDCGAAETAGEGLSFLDAYNGTYGYEWFRNKKYYAQCELYKRIDGKVRAFHTDYSLNAELSGEYYKVAEVTYDDLKLTPDSAASVWKTYKDDNPLYYWLSNTFQCSDKNIFILTESEYADGADRKTINETVYAKVEEYIALLGERDNAYRKALAFHDAIIRAVDYSYDEDKQPQKAAWAHNILGVLTKKGAVCESYSRTFQLLLNYAGVENIFVTGRAGESHAWNLVRLDDGRWYWCDLTWDDPTNAYQLGVYYNYFLVNDTQQVNRSDGNAVSAVRNFLYNHTPDESSGTGVGFLYELPARAAEKYIQNDPVCRDAFTVDGFTYAVWGYNTVQLTGVTKTGNVVIPETVVYNGVTYTVALIGGIREGLFDSDYVVREATSVSIPKTVKYIWDGCFLDGVLESITVAEDNPEFRSVDGVLFTKSGKVLVCYPRSRRGEKYTIPEGCEFVARNAFSSLNYLTELEIGKSVTAFGVCGWGGFYENLGNFVAGELQIIATYYNNKVNITVHPQNVKFFVHNGAVYDRVESLGVPGWRLLCVLNDKITAFEIPKETVTIGSNVFINFHYLENVTAEEGGNSFKAVDGVVYNRDLTRIEVVPSALKGSPVIPDTVTEIGSLTGNGETFFGTEITEITFGKNIKVLGAGAFGYCRSLARINFNGAAEEWKAIKKAKGWANGSNFEIVCSDGTVIALTADDKTR